MNSAMKFSGLSAAVIGIATQVPTEFTAFGFTANECQAVLVAIGVVYAIIGNMFSATSGGVHSGSGGVPEA